MITVALTIVVKLEPIGTTTGLLLSTSMMLMLCDTITGPPGPVVKYGKAINTRTSTYRSGDRHCWYVTPVSVQ